MKKNGLGKIIVNRELLKVFKRDIMSLERKSRMFILVIRY